MEKDKTKQPIVPMLEITKEARELAVAWMVGYEDWMKSDIREKHKLASDVMNYAKKDAMGFGEYLHDNYTRVVVEKPPNSAWVNYRNRVVLINGSDYHKITLIRGHGKTLEEVYAEYLKTIAK